MATIVFPARLTGVSFDVNTFDTIAWSPADSIIGSGSQTESFGNHGNSIFQLVTPVPPNIGGPPFDLSTLGGATGPITQAIVTYADAGTYSTAGPGADYSFFSWGNTHTQADGASWSSSGTWDATTYFYDPPFTETQIEDLPTYDWIAFAVGGNIENGVTLGYELTVLSIEFTYGSAAPVVTDVAPTHGDASGGTVVTLTGTGFTGTTTASFNGSDTLFSPSSDTSGTCVTPAHAVGVVTVTVS